VFVGDEKRLSSLKLIFYSCSSRYLCSSAFSGVKKKKETHRERQGQGQGERERERERDRDNLIIVTS